jgi:hypothetical protein
MAIDAAALAKHWVHSHEEDSEQTRIYRPKGHPFPPARARKELELTPSGRFIERGYGATDRSNLTEGSWHIDGDDLVLQNDDGQRQSRRHIVALTSERLSLTKR